MGPEALRFIVPFTGVDLAAVQVFPLIHGHAAVFTHRLEGSPRDNQDAALVIGHGGGPDVLVVADGSGDGSGDPDLGAEAAKVAVGAIVRGVIGGLADGLSARQGVLAGFEVANERVVALGAGAATTLAACEITGDQVRTYHVGHSRVLVCGQRGRNRFITAVPTDAVNVVGDPAMEVQVSPNLRLGRRGTVVLGSDGLFANLSHPEIIEHLRRGPLEGAMASAIAAARGAMSQGAGSPDDLTLIAYRPHQRASLPPLDPEASMPPSDQGV
ncbi:MAG: hypothetical protein DRJ42_09890 [Deltaproteobacteria bacterium]|nr:MAG: hypothetical protein DRJ42_09890 [Deltaproteobacteria bacterium]